MLYTTIMLGQKKNVSYESGAKQWLNKKIDLKPETPI